jgi:5-methylcytosine-specific restriction endonuclease McrA
VMDIPYTTLPPRKKPVRKVRAKARPNRLKGKAMTELRQKVFDRSIGKCENYCGRGIFWETFHLHHKIHRSLGGKDTAENCAAICHVCHFAEHNILKPCPPKQRIEENSWTPES